MPKQVYKIDQFHGGLSTKTDPKDIQNSEFVSADGFMFDTMGKVTVMGTDSLFRTHTGSYLPSGHGGRRDLYTLSTDYQVLSDTDTLQSSSTATDTNIVAQLSYPTNKLHISDGTNQGVFSTGTGESKTIFYVNGGLRYCDGTSSYRSIQFIDRTDYGAYSLSGWHELTDASIPTPTADGTVGTDNPVETNITVHCVYEGNPPGAGEATEGTWTKDKVHLYYTWMLEDNQETSMDTIGTIGSEVFQGPGATQEEGAARFRFAIYHGDSNAGVLAIDKRIRGCRVYYKTDANDDIFLLLTIDFTHGYMRGMSGTWNPVVWGGTAAIHYVPSSANWIDFIDPPKDFTYSFLNEHNESENVSAVYKAVCVSGNRTYIGNIIQDGVTYTDRMIKSPLRQYDKFPVNNHVDVAINDGDSIIALESYADRILQFKKRTVYVVNTSETAEFVESEHSNIGIESSASVTKTSLGIIWVNKEGVFLYNGKDVTNILLKKNSQSIADWNSKMDKPVIGYIPKERKIIVVGDANNPGDDTYVYDVDTQSWSRATHLFDAAAGGVTNFAIDTDTGACLIGEGIAGSNTNIQQFSTVAGSTDVSTTLLKTKEIDFLQPSVRKKIYKVYVSYKNGDEIVVKAKAGIDSGYTTTYEIGTLSGTGETVWKIGTLESNMVNFKDIKTFQLEFSGTPSYAAESDFEINDISIIYKTKSVK